MGRPAEELLAHVAAELAGISADLKNCARDTTGLMYERGPDGELRLRAYVATADTNSPPEECETMVWAVRGRVQALQDLLEQAATPAPDPAHTRYRRLVARLPELPEQFPRGPWHLASNVRGPQGYVQGTCVACQDPIARQSTTYYRLAATDPAWEGSVMHQRCGRVVAIQRFRDLDLINH